MIKRRLLKLTAVALMVVMTMSLTACAGCGSEGKGNDQAVETEAEREMSTSTDIFAVDIVDKDGNKHKLEGVGVTGEDGKTTITVTDKNGNTTVIKGEAATDAEGNKTVNNAVVEQGGNLTGSNGAIIDTNGATVGGVKDNNDGSTATDVIVSLDKLVDVLEKQEQASKEAAPREQASKEAAEKESREQASKDAVKATEGQTVASTEKETQAVTKPMEIQVPTTAPTQSAKPVETQAPTSAPTTAPTQTPTTSNYGTTDWGATIVKVEEDSFGMGYYTSDGWEIGIDREDGAVSAYYAGKEKDVVVPSTFMGKPITILSFYDNNYVETLTVSDNISDYFMIANCKNLKKLTLGRGITELTSCMISYCYGLKELYVKGTITDIEYEFVDGGSLGESFFSADSINFYQDPQTIPDFKGKTESEYLSRINALTYEANDFKKINFYY